MFCIVAFIIFAILGIFSSYYRQLAKKAWVCVFKKVTLKPCDISLQDELKSRLLGKLILTHPRLARFLDRWINVLAFVLVILTTWSLLVVLMSLLNLFVYDTCTPRSAESCSLGGEACGVTSNDTTFFRSLANGTVLTWAKDETNTLVETFKLIPDRLKTWEAQDYVGESNSYYLPFESNKPVALEIIDPSCVFCAKLFGNIKQVGFERKYNLTYVAYPIPDSSQPGGYKFPNSYLITTYLEAIKIIPLDGAQVSADWQLLETMFAGRDDQGMLWQEKFNFLLTRDEARAQLLVFIRDIGYSEAQVAAIDALAQTQQVADRIADQRRLVEQEIRTIKIPTIMFDGRRYDRVVDPETLSK